MKRAHLAVLAFAGFAACTTMTDPFERGAAAERRGDLVAALRAYEAVSTAHVRHADARAAANVIENRVQRAEQALLHGIVLRGAGRDRDALAAFEAARHAWPRLPSIDTWIGATRDRLSRSGGPAPAFAAFAPAVDCEGGSAPLAEDDEVAAGPVAPPPTFDASQQRQLFSGDGEDPVVLGLVAVEARLGRGELELAVIDLLELARRFPGDARVQSRLARVLHQRALLRYGQGALTTAIADWERVLQIQPENRVVRAMLDAVKAEAATPAQ